MPILGTDTSGYQPPGTYAPGAFEIINIEDTRFEEKAARNLAEQRPTDAYIWVYPPSSRNPAGDVRPFVRWGIGRALAAGVRRIWADYEQDGIELRQLVDFFAVADELGVDAGYYGNDWRFGGHPDWLRARAFWLAAYPFPNDGVFRGFNYAAGRPVNLWQFTSTNGFLDQDVIVDEAWWAQWTAGGHAPPAPLEEEDTMRAYYAPDTGNRYSWDASGPPVGPLGDDQWNALLAALVVRAGETGPYHELSQGEINLLGSFPYPAAAQSAPEPAPEPALSAAQLAALDGLRSTLEVTVAPLAGAIEAVKTAFPA